MCIKTLARKPPTDWELRAFLELRIQQESSDLIKSSEPKSTILEGDLVAFRSLAGLPDSVEIISAGEIRSDSCLEGFNVWYEYPFKIGFKWPFPHLSRSFMSLFSLSHGQLMP